MNKAQLYNRVEQIRNYLHISAANYPLNIFLICQGLDNVKIEKIPFKTRGLRGMVHIAKDSSENHIILLNENKSDIENNYHGTHEFMHIFTADKNSGRIIRCYEYMHPEQNVYVEWLANEGAAEFLVPYTSFIPYFSDTYDFYMNHAEMWSVLYGHCNIYQLLGRAYNVSEIVIRNRIDNLSYEIFQYRNGGNLDNICFMSKTQLQRFETEIEVPNYIENISRQEVKYDFCFDWDDVIGAGY